MTKHLENLDITREYTVSQSLIYDALQWLVANNLLYRDVTISNNVQLNDGDVFIIQSHNLTMLQRQLRWSAYMPIGGVSGIVGASWYRANDIC